MLKVILPPVLAEKCTRGEPGLDAVESVAPLQLSHKFIGVRT